MTFICLKASFPDEYFGHEHFGHGRFGQDISVTNISATENTKGGRFGHNHKKFFSVYIDWLMIMPVPGSMCACMYV